MAKRKLSRYNLLSDEQKEALSRNENNIIVSEKTNSFIGSDEQHRFFQKALEKFKTLCNALKIGDYIIAAFIRWSNEVEERNSLRTYDTAYSQFKNGLFAYIVSTNRTSITFNEIDTDFVNGFEFWLRKNARTDKDNPLSDETQRRYYRLGVTLLKSIATHPTTKHYSSPNLVFKQHAFSTKAARTGKTPSLNDKDWVQLYVACKSDVLETINLVTTYRNIVEGPPIGPDKRRRGRGMYGDWRAALYRLGTLYPPPKLFPDYKEFKEHDRNLADAFQHELGGVVKYLICFYPNVEAIVPFVLLFGIYIHANTGPLRTLLIPNVARETVMDERIIFTIEKPRSHSSYDRSFTVDDSDLTSPSSLYEFLIYWTSRIRLHAGIYHQHVFIFRNEHGEVRGFQSSKFDGRDSDSSWNHAIRNFIKKHNLPWITQQIIRVTGLDTVSQIFDEDILMQKQAGGQKSKAVVELHYNSAAAKARREEALIPGFHSIERWAETGGKIDTRTIPKDGDTSAATPGWQCKDAYDSPISGQVKNRLCNAYGQCPSCPHAELDFESPYSLARTLQLTEEVKQAQTYLDRDRWQATYSRVLEKLLFLWLPNFTTKEIWDAAKNINLPPLARLE
ncbi:phage integrase SAM-like domain-containing protein [Noviherbaspirillum malthae]|uniref:phage integrase SAM-like domain-containing protein n=1 Tax=Noviherbaspirillum malthae TaxID=1260987 RepID=UPI00188FA92C|nr:phage integrase SAM-like domain-containing protein [Noviherbaspirillum malthae]